MRILNVTAQKPDSTGSGIYLSELMKGFQGMGHTQALICGVYQEDEISLPQEIKVYPCYFNTEELPFSIAGMSDEMPYISTRYCDMTPEMTQQFRRAYTKRIEQALEEFKPDMILCHHLYYVTSLVKELARNVPVYGISHGSDLRQIKKNPWQRDYIVKMIPQLDGIFALHKEQKEDIIGYFHCDRDKVRVIGTGYNSHRFYVDEEIKNSKKEKEIRFIFAGKIAEKKGVLSFMNALTNLERIWKKSCFKEQWRIQVALAGGYGNEEEYQRIVDAAHHAPLSVEFLGKLSQEELAKELNRSDVFVLPSFYEGLPLVIVEAMACGLEVICTDLPGIKPWLADKLPRHNVEFITPPKMQNEDEPEADSLLQFEEELARGMMVKIEKIIANQGKKILAVEGLEQISWEGLCHTVLED